MKTQTINNIKNLRNKKQINIYTNTSTNTKTSANSTHINNTNKTTNTNTKSYKTRPNISTNIVNNPNTMIPNKDNKILNSVYTQLNYVYQSQIEDDELINTEKLAYKGKYYNDTKTYNNNLNLNNNNYDSNNPKLYKHGAHFEYKHLFNMLERIRLSISAKNTKCNSLVTNTPNSKRLNSLEKKIGGIGIGSRTKSRNNPNPNNNPNNTNHLDSKSKRFLLHTVESMNSESKSKNIFNKYKNNVKSKNDRSEKSERNYQPRTERNNYKYINSTIMNNNPSNNIPPNTNTNNVNIRNKACVYSKVNKSNISSTAINANKNSNNNSSNNNNNNNNLNTATALKKNKKDVKDMNNKILFLKQQITNHKTNLKSARK